MDTPRRRAPDPSRERIPRTPGVAPERGRGATFNPANRFRAEQREAVDDGWGTPDDESLARASGAGGREARDTVDGDTLRGRPGAPPDHDDDAPPPRLKTTVTLQQARTIIARNTSPDLGFDRSINPYQGCEHGCIYCFARPTHAYLDLSPGLDFETKLFAKPDAARLLRAELARPGYECRPIALGTNTDPYQPIEREWRITRSILEVLAECGHPVGIVTKSALVERDLDLLAPMAAKGLATVFLTVTTLDRDIARTLEPRATAPPRRLQAMAALHRAGVPVGVMVAPVIPQLTDCDLEAILEAAHASGARQAGYALLRLPHEVAPLFRDWLDAHHPGRAAHVMSLVRQMRGGRDYDATWGERLRGTGEFSTVLRTRFQIACRRLGLDKVAFSLVTDRFVPPSAPKAKRDTPQFDLF